MSAGWNKTAQRKEHTEVSSDEMGGVVLTEEDGG